MEKRDVKTKRHKKRKPRTLATPSDSENEAENRHTNTKEPFETKQQAQPSTLLVEMTDEEVSEAFTRFYMQRVTIEFAEDLDRIRNADDFRSSVLPLLVDSLRQGTHVLSIAEQRRVVVADSHQDSQQSVLA